MRSILAKIVLAIKLARREMRGGLSGFRIFLLCLVLGIATIAGIGSLSAALTTGLVAEGQAILGGDIALRLAHRRATAEERSWLAAQAAVSEVATLRSMVRLSEDKEDKSEDKSGAEGEDKGGAEGEDKDGAEGEYKDGAEGEGKERDKTALVELKAVDTLYPLYGAVRIYPSRASEDIQTLLTQELAHPQQMISHAHGTRPLYNGVAEAGLFERLGLAIGDVVRLGAIDVRLVARLDHEPDRTASGFPLAPRLLIGASALDASELVQLGSLVYFHYRLKLPAAPESGISESATITALAQAAAKAFPYAGWQLRDRTDASPSLRRFIERLALFFTAIGLTALVVGGVGVSNAIGAYLTARRESMGIMKAMGASGQLIVAIYGLQIAAFTLLGVGIGLALGASLPYLAQMMFGDILPVRIEPTLYPMPLLAASGFGIISAAAFALPPLGLVEKTPVAHLFGGVVRLGDARPARRYLLAMIACFIGLVAMAMMIAEDRMVAFWFCVCMALAYFALRGAAYAIVRLAMWWRARQIGNVHLRLALANITRPHAPVFAVILSIGLSLTLLASIALVEGNISQQIRGNLPERTPAFFIIDIQPHQIDEVRRLVETYPAITQIETSPMLRGAILAINDIGVADINPPPQAAWILRGDRSLTYARAPPAGGEIVAGAWWSPDYAGAPLLSFDATLAAHLGLQVGDTMVVNILGRPLRVRIANLRHIDWASGGINFAMILSPEPLRSAPHIYLAAVQMRAEGEDGFIRYMARAFPNITVIRVKEALETATDILADLQFAVQIVSAITLMTGLLVLAGAMAGSHHARLYDAVVMKILGGARWRILLIYALEYMVLGAAAALIAAVLASLAAWGLVVAIMEAEWVFLPMPLVLTLLSGIGVAAIFGLIGTYAALRVPAAPILRTQ